MIFKKMLFVLLALFLLFVPLGCSDGSSECGESEPTVVKYGYKLWTETPNKASAHRVIRYVAVETGLGSYDVRALSLHYFMTSNPTYNVSSGSELCELVAKKSVKPTVTKTYSLSEDKTGIISNSSGGGEMSFYMKAGLSYTVNYYF